MKNLLNEIEEWAETYDFSFQFWGKYNNNVFIYKNNVELFSSGGHESIDEVLKSALNYVRKINATIQSSNRKQ